MEIEVYDTYATSEKGIKIHFDVMLTIGENEGECFKLCSRFYKKSY